MHKHIYIHMYIGKYIHMFVPLELRTHFMVQKLGDLYLIFILPGFDGRGGAWQ